MKAVYSYNGDLQVNLMGSLLNIRYSENKWYTCSSYCRKFYKANIF